MRHFFRQFNKYDYLFFAICGVAYYFLIRQYIPCVEDLHYCFSKATDLPLASFSNAVVSQAHDYMHLNGRFLIHVLVQCFCSIWSVIPFYIISACFFALLIMGMTWWVRHQYGTFAADKYLLTAGLLFTIPIIGMTFLGHISFVVNYLWGAAIYVWFMCVYFYLRDERPTLSWWQITLLCLGALIAGAWQESFSIGIAGALFLYHIFRLKETRGPLLYFLLFFAIGVCIEVFAPGNFARLHATSTIDAGASFSLLAWLSEKLYNTKMLVKHCPAITVFVLLLVLIPILQRKRTWAFVKDNYFLLVPCFIMLIFGCFMAFSGEHQFVVIGLFSTILLNNLLFATFEENMQRIGKWLSPICVLVLLAIYIPSFHYRSLLCEANKEFDASIKVPVDSISLSTQIEHIDREVIGNSCYRRYTNLYFIHYSYDSNYFLRCYSRFRSPDHQIHSLVALPEPKEQIMSYCCEANLLSEGVYNSPHLEYYIIRIPRKWDVTKMTCHEGTLSTSIVDKGKDILMHRKGKEKINHTHVGYAANQEDYSRWFVDGEYRYIIRTKPIARKLSSVSISYEE